MPFDPTKIINSLKAIDTLPMEAKDKLTTLNDSLKFVAPELAKERVFYDFKNQQGLISILNEHAKDNAEIMKLFKEIIADITD